MLTRRAFLKYTGGTALTLFAFNQFGVPKAIAQIPGGSLAQRGFRSFRRVETMWWRNEATQESYEKRGTKMPVRVLQRNR